MNKKKEIGKK